MNENEITKFVVRFARLINTNKELYWRVREQLEDPRPIYNYNDDNDYETLIKNIVRLIDSCNYIKNFLKGVIDDMMFDDDDDKSVVEKANIIAKEIDNNDQTRA